MRGRFDLRVVKRLARLIERENYALLHAHTPRTALVGRLAAQRAGVPLVYHVHSPAGRDSTRHVLNAFNALVEWHSLRDADRLIAVSPSLARYMIARGFAADRVVCVPNGVPCSHRHHRPRAARRRLDARHGRPLPPAQGHRGAARGAGRPPLLGPRRAAAGRRRLRDAAPTKRRSWGWRTGSASRRPIDWIGFTRDVNAELAKIDLFVLPSLFGEGLPMVVLEAMAAGVPVVATRDRRRARGRASTARPGCWSIPSSVSQLAGAVRQFAGGNVDYAA